MFKYIVNLYNWYANIQFIDLTSTSKKIYRYNGKKWKQVQPLKQPLGHKTPEIRKLTQKQIDRIMRSQTKL